jgi:hypothetical protein
MRESSHLYDHLHQLHPCRSLATARSFRRINYQLISIDPKLLLSSQHNALWRILGQAIYSPFHDMLKSVHESYPAASCVARLLIIMFPRRTPARVMPPLAVMPSVMPPLRVMPPSMVMPPPLMVMPSVMPRPNLSRYHGNCSASRNPLAIFFAFVMPQHRSVPVMLRHSVTFAMTTQERSYLLELQLEQSTTLY